VISHESSGDLPGSLTALLEARSLESVLVVDNASQDGSVAVARGFGDDRIDVVELDTNTGFAGGCNRGLAALDGGQPYVAFLNPDVEVEAECLERCGERLAEEPGLAAVAPRLMRPDGSTVDSVGQLLRPATLEVSDRGYGRKLDGGLLKARPVLAACGALGVYRRAALEEVADEHGPWAEHYFCFWEDLELGWRLNNRGWRIEALPDAVATHGRGAGARRGRGPLRWRRPAALEACVITNRWMTLIRHLHRADAIRRLPLVVIWDLALLVLSLARRPGLAARLKPRLRLVSQEWRRREQFPRKRLAELPC
jgi:GT2 family glycosyltransferase